jgi:hypothetical protein
MAELQIPKECAETIAMYRICAVAENVGSSIDARSDLQSWERWKA